MSFASESSEISYTPRINYVNGHQSSYRARGLIPGTIYKIQLKAEIKVGDGFQESLPAVTVGWGRLESSDKCFIPCLHILHPIWSKMAFKRFFNFFFIIQALLPIRHHRSHKFGSTKGNKIPLIF